MDRSNANQHEGIVRQIRKLVLAWDSMVQVTELLMHIEKSDLNIDDNLYSPMISGAVTSYARNFVSSDGLGPLSTSYKDFKGKDELDSIHQLVMTARQKIYGHRDATYKHQGLENIYEIKVRIQNNELELKPILVDLWPGQINKFRLLVEYQKGRLEEEIVEKIERLNIVDRDTNNEWYTL